MTDDTPGIGERREANTRRKRLLIFTALGTFGLLAGIFMGKQGSNGLFSEEGGIWPPTLVLGLGLSYLAVIFAATRLLSGSMDELQRQTNYKSYAVAGNVFVIVYPLWFLLWKGGYTGAPIHWILYLLFIITAFGASVFYRYR